MLTTNEDTGYNQVKTEKFSKAIIPNEFLTAPSIQVKSVSECGLFQDFLIVGKTAKVLIVVIKSTETTGCFAKTHIPMATNATIKVTVSNLVISF